GGNRTAARVKDQPQPARQVAQGAGKNPMEVNIGGKEQPGNHPQENGTRHNLERGDRTEHNEHPGHVIVGDEQTPLRILGPHKKLGTHADEPEYIRQPPNIKEASPELKSVEAGIDPGNGQKLPVTPDRNLNALTRLHFLKEIAGLVLVKVVKGERAHTLNEIAYF